MPTPPLAADPLPVPASQKAARSVIQELRSRSQGKSAENERDGGAPSTAPRAAIDRAAVEKPQRTPPLPSKAARYNKRDASPADAGESLPPSRARSVIQEVRARAKTAELRQGGLGAFFGRLFGKGSKRDRQETKRPDPGTPPPQPPPEKELKPVRAAAIEAPPLELSQRVAPAAKQAAPTPIMPESNDRVGSVIAKLQAVKQRQAAPSEPTADTVVPPAEAAEALAPSADQVVEPAKLELAAEGAPSVSVKEMPGELPAEEQPPEVSGEAFAASGAEAPIIELTAEDQIASADPELSPAAVEELTSALLSGESGSEAEAAAHLTAEGDIELLSAAAELADVTASPAEADVATAEFAEADRVVELDEAAPTDAEPALTATSEVVGEQWAEVADDAIGVTADEQIVGAPLAETAPTAVDEAFASERPEDAAGDIAASEVEGATAEFSDADLAPEAVLAEPPAEMPYNSTSEAVVGEGEAPNAEFMLEDDVAPAELDPTTADFAPGVVSHELLSELPAEIAVDASGEVVASEAEDATAAFMSEDEAAVPAEAEAAAEFGHGAVSEEFSSELPVEIPADASGEVVTSEAAVATAEFISDDEAVVSAEPEPASGEFVHGVVSEEFSSELPVEIPADASGEVVTSETEVATAESISDDETVVSAELEPASGEFAHGVISEELSSELPVEIPADASAEVVTSEAEVATAEFISEDEAVVSAEPEPASAEFVRGVASEELSPELLAEIPVDVGGEVVASESELASAELTSENEAAAAVAPKPAGAEFALGLATEEPVFELPGEISVDAVASEELTAAHDIVAPIELEPAAEFALGVVPEELVSELPAEIAADDEAVASEADVATAELMLEEEIAAPEPELAAEQFALPVVSQALVSELPVEIPVDADDAAVASEAEVAAAAPDVVAPVGSESAAAEFSPWGSVELVAEPPPEIPVDANGEDPASETEIATAAFGAADDVVMPAEPEPAAAEFVPEAFSDELLSEPSAEIAVDANGEAIANEGEVATGEFTTEVLEPLDEAAGEGIGETAASEGEPADTELTDQVLELVSERVAEMPDDALDEGAPGEAVVAAAVLADHAAEPAADVPDEAMGEVEAIGEIAAGEVEVAAETFAAAPVIKSAEAESTAELASPDETSPEVAESDVIAEHATGEAQAEALPELRGGPWSALDIGEPGADSEASLDEIAADALSGQLIELPAAHDEPLFGETSAGDLHAQLAADLVPVATEPIPEWTVENPAPALEAVPEPSPELASGAEEASLVETAHEVEASANVEAEAEIVGDASSHPAQVLADGDAEESLLAEAEIADTSNTLSHEEIGWVEPETAVAASLDVVATETAALVEPFEATADEPALETAASLDVVEAEPAAVPVPDQVVVPSMFARLRAFAQGRRKRSEKAQLPVGAPEAAAEPVVVDQSQAALAPAPEEAARAAESALLSAPTTLSAAAEALVLAPAISPEREVVMLESDAPAEPLPKKGAPLTPLADVALRRPIAPDGFEQPAPRVTTAPAAPVPDAAAIESAAAAARALLEAALLRVQSARQRQELIEPEPRQEGAPSPSLALGAAIGRRDAERRAPAAAGSGASLLESVPLAAFVPRTGVQSPEDIANAAAAARILLETALNAASTRPALVSSAPSMHVASAITGAEAAPTGWETSSGQGWAPPMGAEAAPAAQPADWSRVVAATPPRTAALSPDRKVPAAHSAAANIGIAANAAAGFAEDATVLDTLGPGFAIEHAAPPPMPASHGVSAPEPSPLPAQGAVPPAAWALASPLSAATAPHPALATEPLAPGPPVPTMVPVAAAPPPPAIQTSFPAQPSVALAPIPFVPAPPAAVSWADADELAHGRVANAPDNNGDFPGEAGERLAPPLDAPAAAPNMATPLVALPIMSEGAEPRAFGAFAAANEIAPPPREDIRAVSQPAELGERFAPLPAPAATEFASSPFFPESVPSALDDIREAPQAAEVDERFAPPMAPAAAASVAPPLFGHGVPHALEDTGEASMPVTTGERFAPLPTPAPIAVESVVPRLFGQGVPNALDDIRDVLPPVQVDERFAPLPTPAPIAAESVAPPFFGQGVPNALDDIRDVLPPVEADERFAPLPAPAPIAAESVAPPLFGQGVPNALDDIRDVLPPVEADERFAPLPAPAPIAAESVAHDIREVLPHLEADEPFAPLPTPAPVAAENFAPPPFGQGVPNALDDIREEPLVPEADERFGPAPVSPAAETAAPSFPHAVPNALDDIGEAPLPAETETVALPSFPQGVPNALDAIRKPSLEEPSEAAEPASFVPLRSPLPSAFDDIREPEPDPGFASDDNVIAAEAQFARQNAFDDAMEQGAGEPSQDGEEGGDALGEAIESVLASKWYGNGEAPGAPAAVQRAPSPAPPVARQITHDSLLAELRSARQADAPPPEPQPEQGSNRMLVIICVVIGLLAAAGGAAVMSGVGGLFGSAASSSAARR